MRPQVEERHDGETAMAAVLSQPEQIGQRVILRNVTWETYQHLLEDRGMNPQPRYNYFQGVLEIMVTSFHHENLKHDVDLLVELLAAELELDLVGGASTTFQRKDLVSGFEPDACFYIANAEKVRGKKQIDLAVDPPPDLVIEIDISSPSLKKFPIFAALRVPEVWRYGKTGITLHKFVVDDYQELAASEVLPGVTGAQITQLLAESQQMKRAAWLRQVREYAQTLKPIA
jgi:Uma2 family endonuclease